MPVPRVESERLDERAELELGVPCEGSTGKNAYATLGIRGVRR